MVAKTDFPFYDEVLNQLNPHLPMIVNDLSGGFRPFIGFTELAEEYDDGDELTIDDLDNYDKAIEGNNDDERDEFEGEPPFAISFYRGNLPDTQQVEALAESEECDYELIIKPFFTIKSNLLMGLHDCRNGIFHVEIYEKELQPFELLERFAGMITKVFSNESLKSKTFLMTNVSFLAIEELVEFDRPTMKLSSQHPEVVVEISPYFELENEKLHEFLIKQKHTN